MPNRDIKFCTLPTTRGSFIVSYRLERSRRVKRMHLQVTTADYVTIKVPFRQSEKSALSFLRENGDWVMGTIRKQPKRLLLRDYLNSHPRLSFDGEWHPLRLRFRKGKFGFQVLDEEKRVELYFDPSLDSERQLLMALKDGARHVLPPRVSRFSQLYRLKAHGVTVRDQRSRWGSCSETGGISLNWRLILLPPVLQDHIILHELVHLRHFNHSHDFHGLLKQYDRFTREHSRDLDELTPRIISLGRIPAH